MVRTNTEDMSNDATIETLTKELTEDISNDATIKVLTKELTEEVLAEELTDEQIDAVVGCGCSEEITKGLGILKSVRSSLISQQAVKQDVCRVENPPDLLASIVPVEFRYTDDVWAADVSQRERNRRHVGFIAEDVPPAAQICDLDGVPYDVDARAMVAYLWAEVQALRAELTQLRGRIPT